MYGKNIHLGCDVLEQRVVLTASADDFDFARGVITGYHGAGGAIEIPSSINGRPVVAIGNNAFKENGNATNPITTVKIPNSVKTIGQSAFESAGLTSVKIPNSVTNIGVAAFAGNAGLTSVTVGSGVKTIGSAAFAWAKNLTSVTIANGVKVIDYDAFRGATSLTSVAIPNSVRNIRGDAFRNATSLTSVRLGSGVTTIGFGVFANNTGLTSITIGSRVKTIGYDAFRDSGLTSVRFTGNAPVVGAGAFTGVSPDAMAYRAPNLKGYGPNGSVFHGLTVAKPVN